jgi:hypothetical protein
VLQKTNHKNACFSATRYTRFYALNIPRKLLFVKAAAYRGFKNEGVGRVREECSLPPGSRVDPGNSF